MKKNKSSKKKPVKLAIILLSPLIISVILIVIDICAKLSGIIGGVISFLSVISCSIVLLYLFGGILYLFMYTDDKEKERTLLNKQQKETKKDEHPEESTLNKQQKKTKSIETVTDTASTTGIKHVGTFSNGLAYVVKDNKWGFIDKTEKEVIPCIYDEAHDFDNGLAQVKKNGKWGFIDTTGKEVIPCIYRGVYPFCKGVAEVRKFNWDEVIFIDRTGKKLIELDAPSAQIALPNNEGSFSEWIYQINENWFKPVRFKIFDSIDCKEWGDYDYFDVNYTYIGVKYDEYGKVTEYDRQAIEYDNFGKIINEEVVNQCEFPDYQRGKGAPWNPPYAYYQGGTIGYFLDNLKVDTKKIMEGRKLMEKYWDLPFIEDSITIEKIQVENVDTFPKSIFSQNDNSNLIKLKPNTIYIAFNHIKNQVHKIVCNKNGLVINVLVINKIFSYVDSLEKLINTKFSVTIESTKEEIKNASLYNKGIDIMYNDTEAIECLQFINNNLMENFHYSIGADFINRKNCIHGTILYTGESKIYNSYHDLFEWQDDINSIMNWDGIDELYSYVITFNNFLTTY